MTNYEFSAEENQVISDLARWMIVIGVFTVASGVLFIITAVGQLFATSFSLGSILETLRAIVTILFGLAFYLPTDNLRKIVKTEGNDISELMIGLSELKQYLTWSLGLGVIMVPLVLIEALL
ncbi:MAG: hypothetical protein AAF614_27880 [Chloroflexota bacterium]